MRRWSYASAAWSWCRSELVGAAQSGWSEGERRTTRTSRPRPPPALEAGSMKRRQLFLLAPEHAALARSRSARRGCLHRLKSSSVIASSFSRLCSTAAALESEPGLDTTAQKQLGAPSCPPSGCLRRAPTQPPRIASTSTAARPTQRKCARLRPAQASSSLRACSGRSSGRSPASSRPPPRRPRLRPPQPPRPLPRALHLHHPRQHLEPTLPRLRHRPHLLPPRQHPRPPPPPRTTPSRAPPTSSAYSSAARTPTSA